MNQQINLYHPLFRRKRRIFAARTLLGAVGAVAVLLTLASAWGYREMAALEAQVVQLEGREKALAAQIARLDPASIDGQRELDGELERLAHQLARQQKLVDILENQPLGSTTGFSAQLEALARQHTEGLWLTRMAIKGGAARMELAGVSVRPELIPSWLQGLGTEPALSGQRFDLLTIERAEGEPTVSFRVSSRELDRAFAEAGR